MNFETEESIELKKELTEYLENSLVIKDAEHGIFKERTLEFLKRKGYFDFHFKTEEEDVFLLYFRRNEKTFSIFVTAPSSSNLLLIDIYDYGTLYKNKKF